MLPRARSTWEPLRARAPLQAPLQGLGAPRRRGPADAPGPLRTGRLDARAAWPLRADHRRGAPPQAGSSTARACDGERLRLRVFERPLSVGRPTCTMLGMKYCLQFLQFQAGVFIQRLSTRFVLRDPTSAHMLASVSKLPRRCEQASQTA
eukprot:14360287-Alexandrium_andersonii.AAC.1